MRRELKSVIIRKYGYQQDFADAIGSADSIVSRVITGRWNLTDQEKQQWASRLDYHGNIEELFKDSK